MRCPKCGFVSFDFIEKCVKCGKNISEAATDLKGTVCSAPPPRFLNLDRAGAKEKPQDTKAAPEAAEAFEAGGEEDVYVDLSVGGASAPVAPAAEAGLMHLEGGEASPEPEMLVTAEEPAESAIDLSDLAPAEEGAEVGTEEFAFAIGDEKPTVTEAAGEGGQGLEDLKVEGIDLDSAPAPPAGRDKVVPSVKTGTALDNFDVDLGDLFGKK